MKYPQSHLEVMAPPLVRFAELSQVIVIPSIDEMSKMEKSATWYSVSLYLTSFRPTQNTTPSW